MGRGPGPLRDPRDRTPPNAPRDSWRCESIGSEHRRCLANDATFVGIEHGIRDDAYGPSIRSEGIDAIAVIIDTSGSLPAQTLADFWAEVREVATEIQPESVHILQVDAAVQGAAEYAACDLPDEIVIKGRGGTDFRPGFVWLDEQGILPSVCLYLTDMLCSSYPETEPDFATVWCNYGAPPSDWNREPWGERIDIAPI